MCKPLSCVIIIIVAILLFLSQGFYWAYLGIGLTRQNPRPDGGLIALFVISALVMIFIFIIGILGACNVCFPVCLTMWNIGCGILVVVIVIQIIINATLNCSAGAGSAGSIFCAGTANYDPVSWAGLGVTLGLAALGLLFGIILLCILCKDGEDGMSGPTAKARTDYDY